MGLLTNLRDRFITQPVANKILQSLKPVEKAQTPNVFAVPLSFNNTMSTSNKRMTSSTVDFVTLRSISINHETTRAAINTRKRQITQLSFDVVDKDDDADAQGSKEEREQVKQMIVNLGGPGVHFRSLLTKLIEDILVLDACVFYKQRARGGKLLRIIPIDGATIKLRVDQSGARPFPPDIAFEQWIYGKKVAEMTTDELTYEMMNPRNDSPYGLSPIESILITVDASMRAKLYNLAYLSDNNVPQGFLQVPESWNVQQIKEYKEYLDALISGPKSQAKIYPIPGDMEYQAVSKPTDFSFAEFFDYLDRIVCMMFDIQPQEMGLALKQYKENAENQEKIQIRRGIKPLANFLQEIFTDLINNELGFPNYKWKFVGLDGKFTLEEMKGLLPLGILSIDEARNDKGLSKLGVEPFVITGNTLTPVDQIEDVAAAHLDQLENPPKPVMPGKSPAKAKMQKLGTNEGFKRIEKKKEFKDFRSRTVTALRKQLQPFTSEEIIGKVTESKKAASSNISDTVDEEMPSLAITFDNESINQFLKWAAQEGINNASSTLGLSTTFYLTSEEFKRLLGDRANYLIDSVDETTKDWIVNQIVTGKAENLTNAEIAQNIRDEMPDFSAARANTIVNTEVANAVGEGQLDIYAKQGFEEKQWITSEDERVCAICAPMDGEIEKLDNEFSVGVDHEPAHPNCRCYTQAVTA